MDFDIVMIVFLMLMGSMGVIAIVGVFVSTIAEHKERAKPVKHIIAEYFVIWCEKPCKQIIWVDEYNIIHTTYKVIDKGV